jgi:hypothetical protein
MMTPKEKAEELFWNYTKVHNFSAILDFDGNTHIDLEYGISKVKQCALIAVDEIIKELTEEISPSVHGFRHQYWQQVKQEIEKL